MYLNVRFKSPDIYGQIQKKNKKKCFLIANYVQTFI